MVLSETTDAFSAQFGFYREGCAPEGSVALDMDRYVEEVCDIFNGHAVKPWGLRGFLIDTDASREDIQRMAPLGIVEELEPFEFTGI